MAVSAAKPSKTVVRRRRPAAALQLTVVEQTLHMRHRPPPGQPHVEVPARLEAAKAALHAAPFSRRLEWRKAVDSATSPEAAVAALKLVHSVEHLRAVQAMSRRGGGFDTDTYCAPGSWEAMLDGTRAWVEAVGLAAGGEGPTLALSRPAGHHVTRTVAMGFGLVNFAAAAVAAHLEAQPESRVAILDWDVHYGNGVADIFANEPRVRYASLHEAGGFPGSGQDEADRGPVGNLLRLPLRRGAGATEYHEALHRKALPFLLAPADDTPPPALLLVCAGFDALDADPLATMTLTPSDFGASVASVVREFGWPAERVALGLEGGYDLSDDMGMPAALVQTCAALLE